MTWTKFKYLLVSVSALLNLVLVHFILFVDTFCIKGRILVFTDPNRGVWAGVENWKKYVEKLKITNMAQGGVRGAAPATPP